MARPGRCRSPIQKHTHLPEITAKQIEHFFAHYKDLEERTWVVILGWGDAAEAKRMIVEGIALATTG